MRKKNIVLTTTLVFIFILAFKIEISNAETNKGPEEIILNSEQVKMPSIKFNHAQHQKTFACGECHHGLTGKTRTAYEDGMKIQKCVTCHNSTVLGPILQDQVAQGIKPVGSASTKNSFHNNCKGCHKKHKETAAPNKCYECHLRKK